MPRLDVRLDVPLDAFRLVAELDVELDGITVVFGPSGSGKTTFLRAVAGISRRARGRVRFDDEVWQDDDRGVRVPTHHRGLGFVFQDGRLFPHLSVRSNLFYGSRRMRAENRRLDPDRVFALLGLEPLLERRIGGLSGGERQRVAIGRALLAGPRLLLMDEPLASVDVARRGEILAFVERVPATLGIPVIYVTHSLEEMLRLASRLILLEAGRVAGHGAVEDLLSELDRLTGAADLDPGTVVAGSVASYDARDGLAELHFDGGELRVPCPPTSPGTAHRLRIRARDVALALEPPKRASFANVLAGSVVAIHELGASEADVVVDVGFILHSRVTRRAVRELGLVPGSRIYALVKATALDRPGALS